MKFYFYFSFLFILLACKSKNYVELKSVPESFQFIIDSGGNDRYYSEQDKFYRQYLDSTIAVKVQLTENERKLIYESIQKSKFFSMPDVFEPKGKIIMISDPSFKETIIVNLNGIKKYVTYDTGHTDKKNEIKVKPFRDLQNRIWNIIYGKDEIKKLKESDYTYM